jgi:catechol 2,3-dioxygenase-like lactoylglutathione lyase family enzyme
MLTSTGLHHVSLPAAEVVRSSDWYERVLGLVPILMEEEEDVVTMIVMGHRCHVLRCLRLAPGQIPAEAMTEGAAVSFPMDSKGRPDLVGSAPDLAWHRALGPARRPPLGGRWTSRGPAGGASNCTPTRSSVRTASGARGMAGLSPGRPAWRH